MGALVEAGSAYDARSQDQQGYPEGEVDVVAQGQGHDNAGYAANGNHVHADLPEKGNDHGQQHGQQRREDEIAQHGRDAHLFQQQVSHKIKYAGNEDGKQTLARAFHLKAPD